MVFYLGVTFVLWGMGWMTQPPASLEATDEELGAARPYIASPEIPWQATLPQGR